MEIRPTPLKVAKYIVAVLVISAFIGYNAVYLFHKHGGAGFGLIDFAVFHTSGEVLLGNTDLEPIEIYTKDKFRALVQEVRPQGGGTQFLYPAPAALFFALFALMPIEYAAQVWGALSCLFFIGSIYFVVGVLLKDDIFKFRYSALILALAFSTPVRGLMETGQLNSLILFLLVAGLGASYKKADYVTGVTYAIAAVAKVFSVIFIPYFIIKARWQAALSILLGAVLLFVIAIPTFTVEGIYKSIVRQEGIIKGDLGQIEESTTLFGSFRAGVRNGEFDFLDIDSETPRRDIVAYGEQIHLYVTIAFGIFLLMMLVAYRKREGGESWVIDYSMVILFVLLFAKSTHDQYHMWLLPFIVYFIRFPLKPTNILAYFFAGVILFFTQFYGYLPHDLTFTYYAMKPPTLGLLFALLLTFIVRANWWTRAFPHTDDAWDEQKEEKARKLRKQKKEAEQKKGAERNAGAKAKNNAQQQSKQPTQKPSAAHAVPK